MRVLHSSDWHLGRNLYKNKRYDEFEAFLNWLVETIKEERVDVLLLAGDIFDTVMPDNLSQTLYYNFLKSVAKTACRHVVIVAGNHDSASFLNAPRKVLSLLNTWVVGSASEDVSEEVLLLRDPDGAVELIVCAVPYLRRGDIYESVAGESAEDKERSYREGIAAHYKMVADVAEQARERHGGDIPVVAMGHLFAQGGKTMDGDGVRDLYVGSLGYIGADAFSENFDYVALGHLHIAQRVGLRENIRYSGSPIPMGFGEATQTKTMRLLEFEGRTLQQSDIEVPRFQALESIRGNVQEILERIQALKEAGSDAWLEVVYNGEEEVADLNEIIQSELGASKLQVLKVLNERRIKRMAISDAQGDLEQLDVYDIFERLLDSKGIVEQQRVELRRSYRELVVAILEEDVNKGGGSLD
ncbi:MAG: exonuclease SbcCD subunit D C-terminal domain-containing protein [Bradymonadales bacterium]|jgi:exonuclease SbcD